MMIFKSAERLVLDYLEDRGWVYEATLISKTGLSRRRIRRITRWLVAIGSVEQQSSFSGSHVEYRRVPPHVWSEDEDASRT